LSGRKLKPSGTKTVRIHHDEILARLTARHEAGDHAGVLTFADAQADFVAKSPPLMALTADAASAAGQLGRAEALRRQILAIEPGHPSTTNNLIVLLIRRDAHEEAEQLARALIARDPAHVEANHNLGLILLKTNRLAEAEAQARRVLALKPDHAMSKFVLGIALLSQGRFAEGWPAFEARTAPVNAGRNIAPPPVSYPAWRGEPLKGKSILIWMEQGLGDEIMMARYAAVLKAKGARVSLICKPILAPLFRGLAGVDHFYVAQGNLEMPRHDYWTYPMSMPGGCRTTLDTIPVSIPYLGPTPEARARWRGLEAPTGARLWAGLVWKGSATLVNDHNRSLPGLKTLRPLWDVPGVGFFSLQKGQGEDEAASPPPDQPLVDLGPRLTDLDEAAAAIERLDVVVAVDTAVAHLAGAMGKPCLVMLPAIAQDWRWMNRSYSPWYPSLTLFRQSTPGDWAGVVAEVASELRNRVSAADRF
jgi:hypothetical protein